MRKYLYSIVEGYRDDHCRFHLYINAVRRFSLSEMLAKQLWAMTHVEDLPFNEFRMASGAARECGTTIVHILAPYSSAFRHSVIVFSKETKIVEIAFNHVLEFVFYDKEHIEPFLRLVQGKWKGTWEEIKKGEE